ncbi:DUF5343 domain-containing protein [Pseudomonas sp. Marseille-Q8238]
MSENLPYSTAPGTLEHMLEKIKTASVPERVTQDFVSTKLAMKGGSARACIPFLKKMEFVATDGRPTDLYKEFRNPKKSRIAVGKAFRKLYERLYEMNEYLHDANDQDILGMIVECTGGQKDSSVTKLTLATLNMLRKISDFDEVDNKDSDSSINESSFTTESPFPTELSAPTISSQKNNSGKSINLAYTINLNLPATKDIEVFNAIFKSLKDHLLES